MATQTKSMTAGEFAKAAGVSAASISKLIRDGKLKARKEGAKWMISQNQLDAKVVRELKRTSKPATLKPAAAKPAPTRPTPSAAAASPIEPPVSAVPVSPAPEPVPVVSAPKPALADQPVPEARPAEKTYTIAEFAAMTFLTEQGVAEWLRNGRIKGIQKETGEWRVLASNLLVPDISRLVRK
jgi:phage antirepressor YoqD-like protein